MGFPPTQIYPSNSKTFHIFMLTLSFPLQPYSRASFICTIKAKFIIRMVDRDKQILASYFPLLPPQDCVEDVGMQMGDEDQKEVVDDSEDECAGGEELWCNAKVVGLQRRELCFPDVSVEAECGSGIQSVLKSNGNTFMGEDLHPFVSDQGTATLDYVGFEEPGELSQGNALEFVNQFLSTNAVEYSPINEPRNCVREKLSPVLSANGPRTLARYIESRTIGAKCGTFEWNESNQHERVEYFNRRTNAACDSRGCLHKHQLNIQEACNIERRGCNGSGDNSKENYAHHNQEASGSPHLNARAKLNIPSGVCKMNFKDHSIERPNSGTSEFELRGLTVKRNTSDISGVGFGTQMAAEAMADLLHGHSAYYCQANSCQSPRDSLRDFSEEIGKKGVNFRRSAVQEYNFSDLGSIERIRVSKRKRSKARRGNSNFSWKCYNSAVQVKLLETAKFCGVEAFNGDLINDKSTCADKTLGKKSPRLSELRKEPVGDIKRSSSTANISRGKQQLQVDSIVLEADLEMTEGKLRRHKDKSNKHEEVRNDIVESSPIMYTNRRKKRIGKQLQVNALVHVHGIIDNESLRTIDGSGYEQGKRVSKAIERPVITYRRKGRTLSLKPSEVTSAGVRPSDHSSVKTINNAQGQQNKFSTDGSAITCFVNLDARSYPEGKRMHQTLPSVSTQASIQDTKLTIMGQKHNNRLFDKNLSELSLSKDLVKLGVPDSSSPFTRQDLRKRRDTTFVCVLFSLHLDDNIIKQQKKISSRMGISVTGCIVDATHFIADQFVRTRNMLEAIALGKPVVTHSWLESCGQASCIVDEKNYILRDDKKEKEIGFSLPVSLARARQHSLLQGWRFFITPNIKPNKEIITNLVKTASGMVVDQDQITAKKIPEDLLILSCQEDRAICLPLLKIGAAVYTSELLLSGIIRQKLEFERHLLFKGCVDQ